MPLERDEYLPDPVDVEAAFNAAGGEDLGREWLAENDITADLPFPVKMIPVWVDHAFNVRPGVETGELVFTIDERRPNAIAFPIMQDGEFVDLLVMEPDSPDFYWPVSGIASWLGADHIGDDVVRLHRSPLEWLAAGGAGLCQIHSHSRQHMKDLARSRVIQCDDVETALEAWDWGFGADDAALDRFHMDDDPDETEFYYARQGWYRARHRALSEAVHA